MTSVALSILLCLIPLQAQEPLVIQKLFKVGDKERHATKMSMSMPFGEIDVHLKTEQRVLRLFENGDAELESELLEIRFLVNGEPSSVPGGAANRKTQFRVDRTGMPVHAAVESGFGFNFLQFAGLLGNRPLELGKKTLVEWKDSTDPKRRASGSITLESIVEGVASLISNWEIFTPAGEKPLKIDMTSQVEIGTGKLQKASGSITGAVPKGSEVTAIQFSMEAVK